MFGQVCFICVERGIISYWDELRVYITLKYYISVGFLDHANKCVYINVLGIHKVCDVLTVYFNLCWVRQKVKDNHIYPIRKLKLYLKL